MSLTYSQMKGLLQEIKPLLEEAFFETCLAIQARKFILRFKNNYSLLICFQEPFLRFHLSQHPWKEHSTPFSKTLAKVLHGYRLSRCELLQEDRILILVFEKNQEIKKLVCELIPKRANCLLITSSDEILASLNPVENELYKPPALQEQKIQSETVCSLQLEKSYYHLEKKAEFLDKKLYIERQLKNRLKQTNRAQIKFKQELEEAIKWEQYHHEATLLQANLYKLKKGMPFIKVNDWLKNDEEKEIFLDPVLSPSDEIAKRFQKSKKLKRAIDPLKRQLEQTYKNAEKITVLINELEKIALESELKSFCQKNYLPFSKEIPKAKEFIPSLPYREFLTESGLKIWVGKSAKENDKLTFSYANGSDYWLHARDVPGSHVVLHLGKQHDADEESLKDAIQAALFYSKALKSQEGEVCITRCKYVSRISKDQPGKVQISQHRVAFAKIDQQRLKNLRERK